MRGTPGRAFFQFMAISMHPKDYLYSLDRICRRVLKERREKSDRVVGAPDMKGPRKKEDKRWKSVRL